jgi:hypothetical protein
MVQGELKQAYSRATRVAAQCEIVTPPRVEILHQRTPTPRPRRTCVELAPRVRSQPIPALLGFSFVAALLSHVIKEINSFDAQESLSRQLVERLGIIVRKGYDPPEIGAFAGNRPGVLSCV